MNKKIILALMVGAIPSQTNMVFAMKNQQCAGGKRSDTAAAMDSSRLLNNDGKQNILNSQMKNAISLEEIIRKLPLKNPPQYTEQQMIALKNEFANIKSNFSTEDVNGMFLQYCDIFIIGRAFLSNLSQDYRQEKLLDFLKSTLPTKINRVNNSIIKIFLINKAIENKNHNFISKLKTLHDAFKDNSLKEIKQITNKQKYKSSIQQLIGQESISSILKDALIDLIEQLSN